MKYTVGRDVPTPPLVTANGRLERRGEGTPPYG